MSENTILRFKQLFKIIPLSRSSIWRRIKDGSFPKAISLGGRAVGWVKTDILNWIKTQQNNANKPSALDTSKEETHHDSC